MFSTFLYVYDFTYEKMSLTICYRSIYCFFFFRFFNESVIHNAKLILLRLQRIDWFHLLCRVETRACIICVYCIASWQQQIRAHESNELRIQENVTRRQWIRINWILNNVQYQIPCWRYNECPFIFQPYILRINLILHHFERCPNWVTSRPFFSDQTAQNEPSWCV